MKKSNSILTASVLIKFSAFCICSLVIISCGNSNEKSTEALLRDANIQELRERRSELATQQQEIRRELDELNRAIEKINPSRSRALVSILEVQDTVFKHYSQVQGDVATDENILIFPETSGILVELRVTEGEAVSRGQVLARVEDGGLSNELGRLETQAQLARTTYERQERLWNQNIGSEIQYLEAKSNYEAAQQAVQQVQTQVNRSFIRAPFSGTIDEVFVEQGEVVAPGQNQLFRLVNLENMHIEANIPEIYLTRVQIGTEVMVNISSINKEFSGNVEQVGNTINPSNRTFRIVISIPNEDGLVKPNQIASVRFNDYTNHEAIVIPEMAVQQDAEGEELVYIWEPIDENMGYARRVPVETGMTFQGQTEILSGLNSGQQIITEGSRNLQDGQEVELAVAQEE